MSSVRLKNTESQNCGTGDKIALGTHLFRGSYATKHYQDNNGLFVTISFWFCPAVIPVKETHTLEINWSFPCLLKGYGAKPLYYLSWLLGHEGHGSILALLKKK